MDDRPSFLGSYLTPMAPLFLRDDLVEVAINPDGKVWIERKGATHMERVAHLSIDRVLSNNLGQAIASAVGVQFSDKKPTVSGKIVLGDMAIRAQVVAPPIVEGGMAITFRPFKVSADQLIEPRLLHGGLVDLDAKRRERAGEAMKLAEAGQSCRCDAALRRRAHEHPDLWRHLDRQDDLRAVFVVDGGPGERILTIEDAYELFPRQENAVALKADRSAQGERTPARLLEASLRMRPDRIILGELRGEESRTFLEAINTGHGGSFTTIHADTARKAIDRLAIMVMAAGLGMGFEEVKRYCEGSVDLVVQLSRQDGRRGVAEILCL
jgi:type IV secretion system protein VirB11